jgi:photosystem II stability/assembly factor-like uncharacterized protein
MLHSTHRPATHVVVGRCRAVRTVLVALAAVALLAAAACGTSTPGPSDDSTSGPSDSGSAAGGSDTTGTDLGAAVPEDFQPASVTFVSADQGFVLGTSRCSEAPCTSMVATDDGGETWRGLPAPAAPLASALDDPDPDGEPDAVSRVRFGDHLDGWAFGPALWATHDGGAHWAEQHLDGAVVDLASSDGVTYAVVTSCPSGACEQGAALYRTDADADDWQVVDGVSLPAEGGTIELHGRAAWFVGPSTSDGGGATFLSSPDGTSWTQRDDPCSSDDAFLDAVAPVDSTHLFLLCVNDPGAGSQGKSVRASDDAGATSEAAGSPDRSGIATGLAAADADHVAVAARSGASFIFGSDDGGRSWATALELADGGAGLRDLGFTTATQGVVISGQPDVALTGTGATPSTPAGATEARPGVSRLLMTRDAGATWDPVSFT